MLDMITVNGSFLYSPEHNSVINSELKPLFLKNVVQKRLKIVKTNLNKEKIQQNIKNVEQIIFSITNDCNLQCKYCVYNGEYAFERKRSQLSLSYEIAQKGLKYIFTLIGKRHNQSLSICFYGGEPILQFKILKEIVRFARLLFKNWKLSFYVTTNGTRLNKEIIDFFIENNFTILISIDGPQYSHDSKRQYPGGKGSFNDTWNNIKKLRNINKEYYLEKVFFSIVYSNDLPLFEVYRFFTENKIINKNSIRFGMVNPYNTSYYQKYPKHPDYQKDLNAVQMMIKQKLKRKGRLEYAIEKNIADLEILQLNNKSFSTLAGSCDFSKKLLIDPAGKFHICEKMNDKFPIGNVWNGFDFERIQEIAHQFMSIIENNCIHCQWKYLCTPCYIHFAKNGTFRFDNNFCENQKKSLLGKLKNYAEQNSVIKMKNRCKKNKKFHQFIVSEPGPVNTAVFDFLKGNVYQVDNQTIENFKNGCYNKISEFVKFAEDEELLIFTQPETWIPPLKQANDTLMALQLKANRIPLTLEIDENANIKEIQGFFKDCNLISIKYYGNEKIEPFFPEISIEYSKKNFSRCLSLSTIDGNFPRVNQEEYLLQKRYNSCWRFKVAVTKNLEVKPCIYSEIVIGQLGEESLSTLLAKFKNYWNLSKDKVEVCKDCELKYICFDCRELAYRKSKTLSGTNLNCCYNPYTGEWKESPDLRAKELET